MSDQKDAVNIGVTLSTQLIAAALAMIAVVGTFAAFVIDKREIGVGYFIIAGCSFFSFVVSIFLGGKGIDKVRKEGYGGNWSLSSTKAQFNWQATLAFLGIILFAVSVFLGKEKKDELQVKVETQEAILKELQVQDSLKNIRIHEMQKRIDSLFNVRAPNMVLPQAGRSKPDSAIK